MNISAVESEIPQAQSVRVTSDTLHVDLSDGRTISVPVGWYPRLAHATADERKEWRLIAHGRGIHWEGIDEDIASPDCLRESLPAKANRHSNNGWVSVKSVCPNGRRRRAKPGRAGFADSLRPERRSPITP